MNRLEINQLEKEVAEKSRKLESARHTRDRFAQIIRGLRKDGRRTIQFKVVEDGVQITKKEGLSPNFLDVDVILSLQEQDIRFTCFVDIRTETGEPRLLIF